MISRTNDKTSKIAHDNDIAYNDTNSLTPDATRFRNWIWRQPSTLVGSSSADRGLRVCGNPHPLLINFPSYLSIVRMLKYDVFLKNFKIY